MISQYFFHCVTFSEKQGLSEEMSHSIAIVFESNKNLI